MRYKHYKKPYAVVNIRNLINTANYTKCRLFYSDMPFIISTFAFYIVRSSISPVQIDDRRIYMSVLRLHLAAWWILIDFICHLISGACKQVRHSPKFRYEVCASGQHQALVWVRKDELGRLLTNQRTNRIETQRFLLFVCGWIRWHSQ